MTYGTLLYDVRDGIARITLNRPEALNALNREMTRELADVALQAATDPAVRVVILRGAGKTFCAGGDLNEFVAQGDGLAVELHEVTTSLHTAISRLARMNAPVIVAVQGSAAGGGMSLACAGDVVIATESARFTMAYTRIGLTPDGSSSYFLPRIVGLRRTLDLILTNRVLRAREAQEWGIVTEMVPDEALDIRADEIAQDLAAGSTAAFGAAKRLLLASATNSLETQMALETQTIAEIAQTPDAREGIRAFLEKRKPHFEGSPVFPAD
jgi:2-(1,2-epoxy-1,2-dihydrophenyl)acetyl-CoA isomerase